MGTREDILAIAQNLFFTNGYDKTSIQSILNQSGIAKGTFYHYFKSKDDLLCEIVSLFSEATLNHAQYVLKSNMTPLEKLSNFYNMASKYKIENIDKIKSLSLALYSPSNLKLRDKLYNDSIPMVVPIINRIIQEGMETGDFNCPHPNIGEIIHLLGLTINNRVGSLIIKGLKAEDKEPLILEIIQTIELYIFSIESMLAIEHGSLNLFNEDDIRKFLIKLYS